MLYVHLHESAVRGAGGIARVEGLGPMTLSSLQSLLARTRLTVKPVLDLADRVRTTAYEHPESLKERVHLTTGGDYWPYATSTARNVDYDHPTPTRATGPPGQTGTHNSGPLGRRHHRWKTHGGYRARQCGAGRYVWLTPHGLGFLATPGTRRISAGEARLILDAPPAWTSTASHAVPSSADSAGTGSVYPPGRSVHRNASFGSAWTAHAGPTGLCGRHVMAAPEACAPAPMRAKSADP